VTPPLFLVDVGRLDADRIRLDGAEGRHAATVRRLAVGERVDVTDGGGGLAECTVALAGSDYLELAVRSRRSVPAPQPRIVAVQALAKGDRGEFAVEILTELGVDEIVPWAANRSVVRWSGTRGERAVSRWRSTAWAATKQSRRAWLPVVTDPVDTAAVCRRLSSATLPVVLYESAERPLHGLSVPAAGEVVVVVGPEGGMTDDELAAFRSAGASICRLGPTVLRTSTAGAAALSVLLARSGRWA
jgi:16S rRNA (uracil1498-N3)-methyltransferase